MDYTGAGLSGWIARAMSDYKMMKLNADMKCMGLEGFILKRYCFCETAWGAKHDFNERIFAGRSVGATVENLQHLIKDGDTSCMDNNGEAYMKSNDAP